MITIFAILIEVFAVLGTGVLTYVMAKNVWNQAKQTFIQGVAIKALESKTGIKSSTVESLVGKKPMASDPGTAIGGIANVLAGNEKKLSKIASKLPGPFGAVAGLGLKTVGVGASAAEMIGNKTGLSKKITGAKRFLKSQTKFYTNQLKNDTKETVGLFGDAFANLIPEKARRKIKGFASGMKSDFRYNAQWLKDRKNNITQFYSSMAKGLKEEWSQTKGYKLQQNGSQMIANSIKSKHPGIRIKQPTYDPLSVRLNANGEERGRVNSLGALSALENNGQNMIEGPRTKDINRFIKAKRDYNKLHEDDKYKFTGTHFAKEYAEAVAELEKGGRSKEGIIKQRMMLDIIRNTSKDLDRNTLLQTTNAMYSDYNDKKDSIVDKAKKVAEERNKMIPMETIQAEIAENEQYRAKLNKYLETFGVTNKSEVEKLKQDIYKEIAEGQDSRASQTIFTSEEREKLQSKINQNIQDNILYEINKAENRQVQKYRNENPEASLNEARNRVKEENNKENYRAALEEALQSIGANTTNTGASTSRDTQNNTPNALQAQKIVQQTTINQQISKETLIGQPGNSENQKQQYVGEPQAQQSQAQQFTVEEPTNLREASESNLTMNSISSGQKEHIPSQNTVIKETMSREQEERITREMANKVAGQVADTVANKVAGKVADTVADRVTGQVAEQVGDRVAGQVESKITPFTKAIENSYSWVEKLGNGDINRGKDKITNVIDSLSNGTHIEMNKTMEKMFKELGGGDAENGAKVLRQAIENVNKGIREPVADTEYDNEVIYTIAEAYVDSDTNKSPKRVSFKREKERINNRKNIRRNAG